MVGLCFGCPGEMYDYIRQIQDSERLKSLSAAIMLLVQRGKAYTILLEEHRTKNIKDEQKKLW